MVNYNTETVVIGETRSYLTSEPSAPARILPQGDRFDSY